MARDLRLGIRLTADGKGFVGEVRVAEKEFKRFTGGVNRGEEAHRRYSRSAREAARQTRSAHGQVLKYAGAFIGLSQAINATRGTIALADQYTELNNRLRLVTDSNAGLEQVQGRLLVISQETRTDLAANAQLYSKLALSIDALGRSESEVLQVTKLLNQQVAIGGNNAIEARAGLVQFAQGLASGRLQGDELRSVMENLLGVSSGLIIGFQRLREQGKISFDVTRGNIRELAAAGKLTTELLFDAVLASGEDTERKFREVALTVSGGTTQISNAVLTAIGVVDEVTGISGEFAAQLSGVADSINGINLDEYIGTLGYLDDVLVLLAARFAGPFAAGLVKSTALSALATAQTARLHLALASMDGHSRRAAIGMTIASRSAAAFRGSMALLGGPAGVITLGATALFLLAQRTREARAELVKMPDEIERVVERIEKLNEVQRARRRRALQSEIAERQKEIDRLTSAVNDDTSVRGYGLNLIDRGQAREEIALLRKVQAAREQELRLLDPSALRTYQAQQEASAAANKQASSSLKELGDSYAETKARSADFLAVQKELLSERESLEAQYQSRLKKLRGDRDPRELAGDVEYKEAIRRARAELDKGLAELENKQNREAAQAIEDRAERHARAVEQINRDRLSLLPPLEQERAAAEEALRTALAGLDETAAGYDAHLADAKANYESRIARAEDEALNEQRERHAEAVAAINEANLSLLPPLEQARAAADQWRRDQLSGLSQAEAGYSTFVARVDHLYRHELAQAYEEDAERRREAADKALAESTRFEDGITRALLSYQQRGEDAASAVEGAVTRGLDSMTSSLTDFVTTGKFQFRDLVGSILNDLARIAIQRSLVEPLAQGLSGALGGLFGGGGGGGAAATGGFFAGVQYHTGGIVGADGRPRKIPAALLAGAPRLHAGGLAGDEVPAILRRGEEVLPANHPRHRANAGGAMTVNVTQSFDFRGADESAIGRLRAEAERIKRETVATVYENLTGNRRWLAATRGR